MKYPNTQSGFTLLETITAIGVITVSITGLLSLMNSAIRLSETTSNRLIAANLAQEGIELAKNIRDTNYNLITNSASYDSTAWLERSSGDGLFPCESQDVLDPSACVIDIDEFTTGSLPSLSLSGSVDGSKLFRSVDGKYDHTLSLNDKDSGFRRIIFVQDPISPISGSACDVTSAGGQFQLQDDADCIIIRSIVTWTERGQITGPLVVENALYNWNKQ